MITIKTKKPVTKIGFRFIFQSKESTITDTEVMEVMNSVISDALKIETVNIPGRNKNFDLNALLCNRIKIRYNFQ